MFFYYYYLNFEPQWDLKNKKDDKIKRNKVKDSGSCGQIYIAIKQIPFSNTHHLRSSRQCSVRAVYYFNRQFEKGRSVKAKYSKYSEGLRAKHCDWFVLL